MKALYLMFSCIFAGLALVSACSPSPPEASVNTPAAAATSDDVKELRETIRRLEPFFEPMRKPEHLDWLSTHREPGQTFEEYIDSDPRNPTADRNKIYVLPLGTFSTGQKAVIQTVCGYLGAFYGLDVREMQARQPDHPLNVRNYRRNSTSGAEQLRTGYVLHDVLKPMMPKDAAALIAFTAEDLYPDASMNYVFGEASLDDRVGVWSLSRLDDDADRGKFLRRAIKIATHETGHMFSMRHCTKYECVMSGTNYLGETDRRPIDACPECTAKVCWLTRADPAQRFKRLEAFCRRNGMVAEAQDFARKAAAVK